MRESFVRKSIIYLFVALIVLSLGASLVPRNVLIQAQAQPVLPVKIISYTYYIDALGILDVAGEVQNVATNPTTPLDQIEIIADVYSPTSATSIATGYAQVYTIYLLPQQKAPFFMQIYSPTNGQAGSWGSQQISNVTVLLAQAVPTNTYDYQNMTVVNSSPYIGNTMDDQGVYWVSGTIQNTGTETVTNATVVATFYNSTMGCVGAGYTDTLTPYTLNPGDQTTFKVGATDLNESVSSSPRIASYSLQVNVIEPTYNATDSSPAPTAVSSTPVTVSSVPTESGQILEEPRPRLTLQMQR